uniref:NR LBD domain-containing protein n=1 Tax=Heterorhabditis bacteriophora TaxID=37862 RepID=A0A1I7XE36_HETBA
MTMAKCRFASFYWWLCSNWSAQCGCQGIAYANGTYHPTDREQQSFPDVKGVSEKSIETLTQPIKDLELSEAEVLVGSVFVIFADFVPNISEETEEILNKAKDNYIDLLASCCSHGRNELQTATRVGKISLLMSAITDLTYLSSDNTEISDVLHIVEFEDWTVELREHRYKRLFKLIGF